MKKLRLIITGTSASTRGKFGWPCITCGTKQQRCLIKHRKVGKYCCKNCNGRNKH